MVLYPTGVTGNIIISLLLLLLLELIQIYFKTLSGEVTCMVKALPYLSTGALSIQMPNTHNIAVSLYVVVLIILVVYIPGLPIMYSHMNVQRKRAYAKKNEELKKD